MKSIPPIPTSAPKQVRCPACELMQYEREHCRRCKRALPRPEIVFGPMTPVRTLDELERLAIEDALKKSQSVSEAARRLGIGSAIRRLGYLLELYRIASEHDLAKLQESLTATYVPLDPLLPKGGPHLKRWRLQVNVPPQELEAVRGT